MSKNLDELRHEFFVKELGLTEEEVPEAERNLLGLFEVLLDMDRMQSQTNI